MSGSCLDITDPLLRVAVYGIAVVEGVCQLVDVCGVAAVLRDAEHLCT